MRVSFFLILSAVIGAVFIAHAQDADTTFIATVGDEKISQREFEVRLSERYAEVLAEGREMPPDRQFRLAVLNEMVRAKLTQMLARNKGLAATPDEIEVALRDFTRLKGGADALAEWQESRNLSDADVRRRITEKIMSEKLLQHLADENQPNNDAVEAEYARLEEQGALVRLQETVNLAHIFIEAKAETEEAWAEARAQLEATRDRIEAGEDFHAVAKEVSEDLQSAPHGGRYREVTPGEVPAAIEARMFDQTPGEVSEPIRSELGYHLLLVERINPRDEKVSLENARDRITRVLALRRAYGVLSEELQQLHHITRIELEHAKAQSIAVDAE